MSDERPNPRVDVVIPYYKSFHFLREAVESVVQQTMPDFRLLIIDDSPNDLQAKSYVQSLGDPRIEYLSYESNKGINATFELAHKSFRSPWGIILGQDDRLMSNFLEKMLAETESEHSVSLIQSRTRVIDINGNHIHTIVDSAKFIFFKIYFVSGRLLNLRHRSDNSIIEGKRAAAALSNGNFLYFPFVMWNREKTKEFNFRQDLPITSDIDIFFKIFCEGGQLLLIDQQLAEYRRHITSLSGIPDKKLSRLTEETNTYFNCANSLKWSVNPILKFLSKLHISTRLYCFIEMFLAIFQGRTSVARKYLILCLAISNVQSNKPSNRKV